jgi:hypothetical protein
MRADDEGSKGPAGEAEVHVEEELARRKLMPSGAHGFDVAHQVGNEIEIMDAVVQ